MMQAPASDYIKTAAETVLCIHRAEVPGDILVFVATASEVQQCMDIMDDALHGMAMRSLSVRLQPLALHGGTCPAWRIQ
jgi:HrpA-like RNA helicase